MLGVLGDTGNDESCVGVEGVDVGLTLAVAVAVEVVAAVVVVVAGCSRLSSRSRSPSSPSSKYCCCCCCEERDGSMMMDSREGDEGPNRVGELGSMRDGDRGMVSVWLSQTRPCKRPSNERSSTQNSTPMQATHEMRDLSRRRLS